MQNRVLSSRRFWVLIVNTFVSLVVYFGGKYLGGSVAEDIRFVVAVLQPIAGTLILAYTIDDISAARLNAQVQIAQMK